MKKNDFQIVVRGDIGRAEWLYILVTINKILSDHAYPAEAVLENIKEERNGNP